jgi:hypothetical protein
MAGPVSISVKQVSAAAKSTVAKVLEQHKTTFPKPDYVLGFYPPHWWLGIVIRNPDLDHVSLGEAQKVAVDLQRRVGSAVAATKGGKPGVVLAGGYLTIGFAPPEPIIFGE